MKNYVVKFLKDAKSAEASSSNKKCSFYFNQMCHTNLLFMKASKRISFVNSRQFIGQDGGKISSFCGSIRFFFRPMPIEFVFSVGNWIFARKQPTLFFIILVFISVSTAWRIFSALECISGLESVFRRIMMAQRE